MTPEPRIEPRPHWWEASPLTTTPPLLSVTTRNMKSNISNTRNGVLLGFPKSGGGGGAVEVDVRVVRIPDDIFQALETGSQCRENEVIQSIK